ncbi:hypothetical protein [uncultured Nostoc sp.]
MTTPTQKEIRLAEAQNHIAHWRRWGPYLSDRHSINPPKSLLS